MGEEYENELLFWKFYVVLLCPSTLDLDDLHLPFVSLLIYRSVAPFLATKASLPPFACGKRFRRDWRAGCHWLGECRMQNNAIL